MLKKINNWLESEEPDYDEGLLLLQRSSRNRNLINMLSRKERPKKLRYELAKIAERLDAKANTKQPEPPEHLVITGNEDIDKAMHAVGDGKEPHGTAGTGKRVNPNDLDDERLKIWKDNQKVYAEMRENHLKLRKMENEPAEERAPLVKKLLELEEKRRSNWNVIDAWVAKKGDSPEPETPVEVKPVDAKRIAANRKFISTNKDKLKMLDGDKKESLFSKMKRRVNEILVSGEKFSDDQEAELKKNGLIE